MVLHLHSVLISKDIPIEEAKETAQKFIKDKSKKFYKVDKNYYVFRNIPKQKFKNFVSKKINDEITIVLGELLGAPKTIGDSRELNKDDAKYGAGFMDFLKDPISHIKEAFSGIPTKLNNISTDTMKKYGDQRIASISIVRTPLNKKLEGAINALSMGKFNEAKKQEDIDKLYHLSLLITTVDGVKIVVEKNETVNIEPLESNKSFNGNSEFMNIPLNKELNLKTLIDKTISKIGDSLFYSYDSFTNNCQNFIKYVLESNNLLTDKEDKFIFQDVSKVKEALNPVVPKIMNKVTNFGSFLSRLRGRGKREFGRKFYNYLIENNLDDKDLENVSEKTLELFVKFMEENKFKFL